MKFLTTVLTITAICTVGCSVVDPYASAWDTVKVGDSRASAVQVLGSPSIVNSVEVPLVKLEQLAWRPPFGGRVYLMVTALDRVIAKSVIN